MFRESSGNNSSRISAREKISRPTERTLDWHEELFGFKAEELEGKKVLNVGAGDTDLEAELEERGIKPQLVANVDIGYSSKAKNILFRGLNAPQNAVAADMKELPFKEETFNKIFCLWSLSWLENNEDKLCALKEMLRVADDGGEINIYPVILPKNFANENFKFITIEDSNIDSNKIIEFLKKLYHDESSRFELGKILNPDNPKKLRKGISDFDYSAIELVEYFLNKIRGKTVCRIKIAKSENSSVAEVEAEINKLMKAGVAF